MLKNLNAKQINTNDNFLSCRGHRVRGKKKQCPLHRHCQVTKDLLYLSYVFFSHFVPLIYMFFSLISCMFSHVQCILSAISFVTLAFGNYHNPYKEEYEYFLCFYFKDFKSYPTHKKNLFSVATVDTLNSSDKVTFFFR